MVKNNLYMVEKNLRSIAKRYKGVKYSLGLAILFLMMGLSAFSQDVMSTEEIAASKENLVSSVETLQNKVEVARKENQKAIDGLRLELIQLMEQGDQVVKSPWASWQFGANYMYNDWRGTYKGRGDKAEKYPYEGVFTRSENPYERYTSPDSSNYASLGSSSNPQSASTNSRGGLKSYGLGSTKTVKEPIVGFEVSAGINPRVFNAPTVNPLNATQPNLPQAINFAPVTPVLVPPTVDTITIPTIEVPGTGNYDDMYIMDGSNNTALAGSLNNQDVAMIAQYSTSGGTMNVNVNNGSTMDISTSGVTFTGHQGASHNGGSTYSTDLNTTGYSGYSAMKLVGGHEVKIDNTTINFKGTGTDYQRWLFHTDGHNNHGNSTWNVGSGSNINIDGSKLVMYTSQYHGSGNTTVGFTNSGKITTSATGSDNYIWMTLEAGAWPATRVMAFENKGTIELNGTNETFTLLGAEYAASGGFTFVNDGTLQLKGANNKGILVKSGTDYLSSEILLNNAMEISGDNSVGIGFLGYADLEGGKPYNDGKSANNAVISLPTTSRESVLNIDLKDNIKSTALYFKNSGTNIFKANNFNLTSTNGTKNTLVYVEDGKVELNAATNGKMEITGGSSNVGIYTKTASPLKNNGKITISNSDSSVGIYANSSGAVTNTGAISVTGKSVKAIVADNSTVTSSGQVDVTGTALSDVDGAVGLVATNGGTLTQTGGGTITVDGGASIGALAQSGGTVDITGGSIKATDGAFNTYAQGGTIKLNGTTVNTEQKSLAFFADNSGHINFTGPTTANIAGGTDANTRGTAFYYKGSGYSPFRSSNISGWAATTFGGTINNLTLNMASGSRLFIASDVSMDLSDTAGTSLAGALGATINGNDYKTFMLYLSKLGLNQSINLDNANDAYNQLEISNSSIDNNNSNTITGTQAGQTAIAQENLTTNRTAVTLNNNGAINLSGVNSTGMYAKHGVINNNATGTITLGDTSTGLYGTADSILTNTGTITIGNSSTAMYSEGSTTQGVTNAGTITSTGTSSVGVLFKPDATLAAGTTLGNTGTITLGDSSVGLYGSNTATNYTTSNSGTITVGNNGIAMFGYASDVTGGTITVGDKGVGVYSQAGNVNLTGGNIVTGANEAVAVYTVGSGQTITNSGTTFTLGDSSVAIANAGSGNTISSTIGSANLGTGNIYIYSNDSTGTVTNSTNLTSTNGGNYGIYSAGTVTNTGNMNFGTGEGNVGIYSIRGGNATNSGTITIGASDPSSNLYSIGMAAGYRTTDTGNITNNGTINVNGEYSLGMYASGAGSTATNNSNIVLNANNTTGIYADNGATAVNTGNITTGSGTYENVVGVYLGQGSTLNNSGSITINSANGVGVYLKGGTVVNRGNITVNGSNNPTDTDYSFTTPPTGKAVGGAAIDAPQGATSATVTINGVSQTPVNIHTYAKNPVTVSASSIGLYVNTSGVDYTNAINGLGNLTTEADLIIGTEATEMTNSKSIVINDPQILNPYNDAIRTSGVSDWNIYSGGLTWLATPTLNPADGTMTNIYMVKIPYTAWAANEPTPVAVTDTYNFLDGLEQRYGVEALGTRENKVFQKLNSIGNNEEILFHQATDEMMGHQYANVQQRIQATGDILNKEFDYLRSEWQTVSKDSNKVKVFGTRGEYNTDTAGVIDYRSHAYGVAYVHEDETVKMGDTLGWYAGIVHNRFKFKDIGGSREEMLQGKVGLFKSVPFDDNNSLNWTISGDISVGYNKMHRRFLVVDEVFHAKGRYRTYGIGIKNEISKDFRLSESFNLRPYVALGLEYGRFSKIKEKSGEIRLDVKSNDYFSIRPEIGAELGFKQYFGRKTLRVGVSVAYENELGRVANGKNKARVAYTTADWFNIRGEKEDRRGNVKTDLNIGVDNQRIGLTGNIGYDTKGHNIRGGVGLRVIF